MGSSKVLFKTVSIIPSLFLPLPLLVFLFLLVSTPFGVLIAAGSGTLLHKPHTNTNHLLGMPVGAQGHKFPVYQGHQLVFDL